MELKKCMRCGCFFASENDVCSACEEKDKKDIYNLNSYIVSSSSVPTVDSLSFETGVTIKNINRFIDNNSIANF